MKLFNKVFTVFSCLPPDYFFLKCVSGIFTKTNESDETKHFNVMSLNCFQL